MKRTEFAVCRALFSSGYSCTRKSSRVASFHESTSRAPLSVGESRTANPESARTVAMVSSACSPRTPTKPRALLSSSAAATMQSPLDNRRTYNIGSSSRVACWLEMGRAHPQYCHGENRAEIALWCELSVFLVTLHKKAIGFRSLRLVTPRLKLSLMSGYNAQCCLRPENLGRDDCG